MPKEYDSLYKSAQFFINKIFDTAEGGTPWNETRFIFLEETAEQTKHTKLQGLVDAMRAYQTSKVSVMHMTKKDPPDIEAALQFDIIQPAVQRQVNLVLISYFDETSLIDDLLWNLRQRYINRSKGHATALMWHSVTVKIFRLIDDTHNINYQQKIEELSNILYSNFMLDQPDIADKYFPNCSVTHFFRETDNITSRKLFLAGCVGQKNDLLRAKDYTCFKQNDYPWIDLSIARGDNNRMLVFHLIQEKLNNIRRMNTASLTNMIATVDRTELINKLALLDPDISRQNTLDEKINGSLDIVPSYVDSEMKLDAEVIRKKGLLNTVKALSVNTDFGVNVKGSPHKRNTASDALLGKWYAKKFVENVSLSKFLNIFIDTANVMDTLPKSDGTILISSLHTEIDNWLKANIAASDYWSYVLAEYKEQLNEKYVEALYHKIENEVDDLLDYIQQEISSNAFTAAAFGVANIAFNDCTLKPFCGRTIREQMEDYICNTTNFSHNQPAYKSSFRATLEAGTAAAGAAGAAGGPCFIDISSQLAMTLVPYSGNLLFNNEAIPYNAYYPEQTAETFKVE